MKDVSLTIKVTGKGPGSRATGAVARQPAMVSLAKLTH